jgi:small multidrug resistance pump
MAYFYLLGAIVLEVCGTTSMELSQGFTKVLPSVLIEVFYELSFTLQTMVLKKIEVSMA